MISMIPTPDSIPVSWGYFQFFLMLTFPLHLFFMNAMIGSSAVAIYTRLRGDDQSKALAHELAKVIPLLIALAVNFGVAPLLFVQVLYGHLFYSSSILIGFFWIMVIPLLLIAYYATYWFDFKFTTLGRGGVLLLLFAWLVFLGIGFIFSNNMTLMLSPVVWTSYLGNSSGTLLNTGDPTLWPRYLHFMVGGSAIGGLFVALYGRFLARKNPLLGERAEITGMKLFLVLSLLQIVVGVWFLLRLPREQMLLFMGHNGLASAIFIAALILVVVTLVNAWRRKLYPTALCAALLIYLMVFMRDFVRSGYLKGIFSVEVLQVRPEYSPLIFFLVTLIIGLGLVAWMIRAAFTR